LSSEPRALLLALQYGDSAYPAGAFAHSWGLETAVAEGDVRDAAQLEAACRALLRHQAGPVDAAAAAGCREAAVAGDFDRFSVIDRRVSAARVAREAREASARVGRRLIAVSARAEDDGWLGELQRAVQARQTPGNQACVLGALAGRGGLQAIDAATLVLWTAANGLLSAALRLLPLSHDDVQAILVRLRPSINEAAAAACAADPLQLAGSAPQFDLWAMRHETAAVRLFAS
jgi:urease accessory protein